MDIIRPDPTPPPKPSPGPICYELYKWVDELHSRIQSPRHKCYKEYLTSEGLYVGERPLPKKLYHRLPNWQNGESLGAVPHECGDQCWSGARNGFLADSCNMCGIYRKLACWQRTNETNQYYKQCRCEWCMDRRGEP